MPMSKIWITVFVSFYLWFILDQSEKQTETNPVLLMDEALARLFMK